MAKELVLDGVTVNCIAPAMTASPLLNTMTPEFIKTMTGKIPMGRLVEAAEVAEGHRLEGGPGEGGDVRCRRIPSVGEVER